MHGVLKRVRTKKENDTEELLEWKVRGKKME
jgi:hypothetical protein